MNLALQLMAYEKDSQKLFKWSVSTKNSKPWFKHSFYFSNLTIPALK